MFNFGRVHELEEQIKTLNKENAELASVNERYKSQVNELEYKLGALTKFTELINEGCTEGPWCQACEFVKTYHIPVGGIDAWYSTPGCKTFYVCGKGKSCSNFVQRKAEGEN